MDPAAYGITDFCQAHGISRGLFYKMVKRGIAPRVMQIGTRKIISREAAAEWRRERESPAAAPRQLADVSATRIA